MTSFNSFFNKFYQAESEQETSLDDIPVMSSPPNLGEFPQICDSLAEIQVANCPYPNWDNEETIPFLSLPAIRSIYPSGFDSGKPIPTIFDSGCKPVRKALCPTDPKNGIMQDTTGLNLSEIADAILSSGSIMEIQSQLAYYEPPRWRFIGKADAAKIIMRILNQIDSDVAHIMRHHHLTEIHRKLVTSQKLKAIDVLPTPDYHMLCCRDGMYCWPQGNILRHDSQYYRFSHLNVSAEDIAPQDTPYFDLFLDSITQGDADLRQLILEVIGVILSGYPCKQFFIFQGASNSGKSQLASFLKDVLGLVSCYAVNGINQLSDPRVTSELPGKLLLLCSDVPDVELKADTVAIIKELTGDDPIFANSKYKQPFYFSNSAKLLFLSNFPLRLYRGASDEAFLNRMLQIPFRFSVPKERQIENIHSKLFQEAGGILWKALETLLDFEDRGGVFTQVEHIVLESDPTAGPALLSNLERILSFVRQCCVLESAAHSVVSELYTEFLAFDRQECPEAEQIQSAIFSRALNQSGLPIRGYRTAKERGYRGIRLKQESNLS